MGKNTQDKNVLMTREFSSGGVVYKPSDAIENEDGTVLWLVRRTASSKLYPKTYWMLPKGRIDDTEDDMPGPMSSGLVKADENSLRATALREVSEEGGVETSIVGKIETIKYLFTHPERGKIFKFVTFYLMRWKGDLSQGFDDETSEIAWLPYEAAYKKLSFSGEKQVLKKAKDLLASVA